MTERPVVGSIAAQTAAYKEAIAAIRAARALARDRVWSHHTPFTGQAQGQRVVVDLASTGRWGTTTAETSSRRSSRPRATGVARSPRSRMVLLGR